MAGENGGQSTVTAMLTAPWSEAERVTVSAEEFNAPEKTVEVTWAATGGGAADPAAATLTIADDEPTPSVFSS